MFAKMNLVLWVNSKFSMIPVCQNEISACLTEIDFTLRLHGEIKFHPGKAGQRFLCKHEITFSPHLGGINRLFGEFWFRHSGNQAVQKRDPSLPGLNFQHVIAEYNLWIVYNAAGVRAKRGRISSQICR